MFSDDTILHPTSLHNENNYNTIIYCILHGRIKGFNISIITILFEVGSYRTVVG